MPFVSAFTFNPAILYVALSPVKSNEKVELYKIKFDKDWNESLEEVSSEKEISMFEQVSKIKVH